MQRGREEMAWTCGGEGGMVLVLVLRRRGECLLSHKGVRCSQGPGLREAGISANGRLCCLILISPSSLALWSSHALCPFSVSSFPSSSFPSSIPYFVILLLSFVSFISLSSLLY